MHKILIPGLGLVALVALSWACVHRCVPAIEADLAARAAAVLADRGCESVRAEIEGLDVRLSGWVASPLARDRAIRLVAALEGVRRVETTIQVGQTPSPGATADSSAGTAPADRVSPGEPAPASPESGSRPPADPVPAVSASATHPSEAETVAATRRPEAEPPAAARPVADEAASATTAADPTGERASTRGEAAEPPANAVKACQREIDALLAQRRIQFVTASAGITDASTPLLDGLRSILAKYPEVHVEIAGHTDSRGIDELNLRLSQARAEAVRNYLIHRGIAASRLVAIGFGATRPIALNDTEDGRAKNRRIEFYVRGTP